MRARPWVFYKERRIVGIKMNEGGKKTMRWLAFARLRPWHYTLTFYALSISAPSGPNVTSQLMFVYILHTYLHAHLHNTLTQAHTCPCRRATPRRPHSVQFMEGKATFPWRQRVPSITPITVNRAWLLGLADIALKRHHYCEDQRVWCPAGEVGAQVKVALPEDWAPSLF